MIVTVYQSPLALRLEYRASVQEGSPACEALHIGRHATGGPNRLALAGDGRSRRKRVLPGAAV